MVGAKKRPPVAVAFSPTDPTGGAGLQADILTLHALGCHALSISTGTTAQNADRCFAHVPMAPRLVRAQFGPLRAAAAHCRAAKVGAVGSPALARELGKILGELPRAKLVVDPVLAPTGGQRPFADARTVSAMRAHLLGRAEVLAPNGAEARALTGRRDVSDAAAALLGLGCAHVLVSSLAARGKTLVARLYSTRGIAGEWGFPRGSEGHGTGCTLAAAVAAHLAMGRPTPESVDLALHFAYDSLASGYPVRELGKKRIPRRLGAAGGYHKQTKKG